MVQQGLNMPAVEAGGALAGARQRNPAICKHVNQLIDDMRSDMYMAVRIDEFVKLVNERLRIEEGNATEATVYDVVTCLRYDPTVKVYITANSIVLWLWSDWMLHRLINEAVDAAEKHREVMVSYREGE